MSARQVCPNCGQWQDEATRDCFHECRKRGFVAADPERFPSSVVPTEEYARAVAARDDRWVAACGGTEEPFEHQGRRLLYVFNPATGDHAYLDLATDLVSEDMNGD